MKILRLYKNIKMNIKEKIERIKMNRLTEEELNDIDEKMDDLIRLTSRPLTDNEYQFFEKHLSFFPNEHKCYFKWSVAYEKQRLIDMIVKYYNPNNDVEYSKNEIEFCLNDGYHRNVYSYVQYGFVMTDGYYNELRNKFKNDSYNEEIFAVLRRVKFLQKKKNKGIKYIKTKK